MLRDIVGKRLTQVVRAKSADTEVYFRKADAVVLCGRRPLAKVVSSSHGTPEVFWNAAGLMATCLDKRAIMGELGRLLLQGPAEPEWSRGGRFGLPQGVEERLGAAGGGRRHQEAQTRMVVVSGCAGGFRMHARDTADADMFCRMDLPKQRLAGFS